MGAPAGNQFWKLRSKHGRDKIFASPELMWDAACEYFQWCEDNPIVDPRSFGGKAKIQRPFTLQGLALYLDVNTTYFRDFKASLPKDEKDFSPIITRIEEIIFAQKFENAAIGVYQHNIIARELGLVEKKETDNKHTFDTGAIIDWGGGASEKDNTSDTKAD